MRAFGDEPSYASIAVVFLAGNALGSAAPDPRRSRRGGGGADRRADHLRGAEGDRDARRVLLFRLMTLWLPVLPGWLSFTQLTRKGEL